VLSSKRRFDESFDAGIHTEQISSPRLLLALFFVEIPPGSRDKEFIQVSAPKCE
jgi:hypothetical protein